MLLVISIVPGVPLLAWYSASLSPGVISKSGFQYGKFANNLFSILKQLVTVPKMGKIHHISNMTFWGNFAIFETTAKNSVLAGSHLQYEKKMKKFDLNQKFAPKSRNSVILVRDSGYCSLILVSIS